MIINDLLTRLAKRGHERGGRMESIAGPWLIECDGTPWAMATDAIGMVFSKDYNWKTVPPFRLDDPGTHDLLRQHFQAGKALTIWEGPLKALKEFCGPPLWEEPCPACKGTSKDSEHVSCSLCDGNGGIRPEPHPGYIIGLSLDLRYLATLLEPFTVDISVRVSTFFPPRNSKQTCLVVSGQCFCVLLMSMEATKDPEDSSFAKWLAAPRFPAEEK